MWHGLKGGMFEPKLTAILEELETLYVRSCLPKMLVNLQDASRYQSCGTPKVIDMDQIHEPASSDNIDMLSNPVQLKTIVCGRNLISFPHRKNQHTSYLFALHNHHVIPWNYHSIHDEFFLQAKMCTKWQEKEGQVCIPCEALRSTLLYNSICIG